MNYKIDTEKGHEEFHKELTRLAGRYRMGQVSRTPCDVIADVMLNAFDSFACAVIDRDERMQKPQQKRPCADCDAAEQADDDEETNELGYIVFKHGKKPGKYVVFAAWRNGIPLFARNLYAAMIFKYRGMAEHVAGKLVEIVGGKWEVIDLDELEENHEANERLLKAIFGEVDEEGEPEE